ncbi:hypothetical protein H0W80_04465, partial [Candidatus Saccharibacteria bacterium]|nr:hypothetical protein [Candidatus Saccharibacteria bacterium]
SYGVPGVKYNNKLLISFAAFKHHYSLFPGSVPITVLKDKLKDYETSKGTLRYTQDHLVPAELIESLIEEGKKLIDNKQKSAEQ